MQLQGNFEQNQNELDQNVIVLAIIITLTVGVLLVYGSIVGPFHQLFESLRLIEPQSNVALFPRG